ncbi:MAG TPA: hypothetical protein VNY05_28075 [Candidatus Acidoferrales bacterium]|nr:hypothetical protein [Candidatus Acidoferrales bacterium]
MLNSNSVQYLVIGGYAVNYCGFARATAVLREFGFPQVTDADFLEERRVIWKISSATNRPAAG